jgi:hypothetical protein
VFDACAPQVHRVGVGHSGDVTALAVAPDKSAIVSTGSEGGIFIWQYAGLGDAAAADGGGDDGGDADAGPPAAQLQQLALAY